MNAQKKRWLGVIIFTLLYPATSQFFTSYLPNPMVPGATIALNMIFPVLAGYFYGAAGGAVAGGVGTALAALGRVSLFDGMAILPHAVMGIAAGWTGQRRADLLASLTILIGHGLNMLFFLRLKLITIAPEDVGLTLVGLAAEALVDMVAIVLMITLLKKPMQTWAA